MHTTLDSASGPLKYRLTNDLMFHIVMTENPDCLCGFLASLLSMSPEEILDVRILNPIDVSESVDAKEIVLDLKLHLNYNKYIDIELQVTSQPSWNERALFYTSRMISRQNPGKFYEKLQPVLHIGILDFPRKGHSDFYERYLLKNSRGDCFSDKFELRMLNIRNLKNASESDRKTDLATWAQLFQAATWEDVRMLAAGSSLIRKAGEAMQYASISEEEKLERREKAQRDWDAGLYWSRREGLEEGMQKGLREGYARTVRALCSLQNLPAEKAMDMLKIPAEDRPAVAALLNSEE